MSKRGNQTMAKYNLSAIKNFDRIIEIRLVALEWQE